MVTKIKSKIPLKFVNIVLATIGLFIVTTIIFIPYIPYSISLKQGELSGKTIVAPKTIEFASSQDKQKTTKLQDERAALIEKQFSIDENITKTTLAEMVSFFTLAKQSIEQPDTILNTTKKTKLALSQYQKHPNLTVEILSQFEAETLALTQKVLEKGLSAKDRKNLKSTLIEQLKSNPLSPKQKNLIIATTLILIQPNLVYNEAKTQDAINKALDSITPFTTIYRKGTPIVYEGEKVTPQQIEIFRALNIYGVKPNIIKFFGILLINFFLFLLYERFNYQFTRNIYNHPKYFYLTFIVAITIIVSARFLQSITPASPHIDLLFLIPIPLITLITSSLISPNIALLSGTIVAIMISVMTQGNFGTFFFLFISSCATTFITNPKYKRTQLIKTGYTIGLINIVIVIAIGLFTEQSTLMWYVYSTTFAFFNGILSAMMALALLPYCESLFKITTSQTLLELSNLDHPLLKRLMMTAPGTYQHSIMVANLAEAAAEAINANTILARVGAYYHDIGKMKRPSFYIENQTSENPHDGLTPRMSKMIIASHPKDGVDLATKYKLPNILKDFMLQHHGTCLVGYFYEQAIQSEEPVNTDLSATEQEFRYLGPKPQFKESGIVMLADTIEATIRSIKKPNPAKIESLVNKLIKDKIEDNQLDECPISLREIDIIRTTFLTILKGMHHHRIDYQEEIQQLKKTEKP